MVPRNCIPAHSHPTDRRRNAVRDRGRGAYRPGELFGSLLLLTDRYLSR
jgi:hypothetical protein